MAAVGDRIELTTEVHSIHSTHQTGAQGEIRGIDPDGYYTARMDDGRTNFPHHTETVPTTSQPKGNHPR